MAGRAQKKGPSPAQIWRMMTDFTMAEFARKSHKLADLGLTLGHFRALSLLDRSDARPMGACASELGCDASTATWLIDRLEERGLAERRASGTDRRVRAVVLTAEGAALKAKLEKHLYAPPAALGKLDRATLEHLYDTFSELHPSRERA